MCDQHDFIFDFEQAYNHQLLDKFEASPEHSLELDVAPRLKGVYALYHLGAFVYAGEALTTTLQRRLNEHFRKIVGRQNIDHDDMACCYLVMDNDWFIHAAEAALIRHYQPLWQRSGFGSHVPGIGRPGIRISQWDQMFPPR